MLDEIAQLCQIIAETLRNQPEVTQHELMAQVEMAIATDSKLESTLRINPQMLQTNRDGAIGYQTVVKGGTDTNGATQIVLSDPEKFQAAFPTWQS